MEFHRVIRAAKADPATPEEEVDQTVHIMIMTHKDEVDSCGLKAGRFCSNLH